MTIDLRSELAYIRLSVLLRNLGICPEEIKDQIIFTRPLSSFYVYLTPYIKLQLVCLQILEVKFRNTIRPMMTVT